MIVRRSAVTVLGAGLSGVGTALALARRGVGVTLVDQDACAINRASLRNEGKIHLGFIYANDKTLATARLQLEGALTFRSLLYSWIGPRANALPVSAPFVYLVAADSLLSVETLDRHYAAVESVYNEHIRHRTDIDYLGERPTKLYEKCPEGKIPAPLNKARFIGAFITREVAIDTAALAVALRECIKESDAIQFLPGHKVHSLERANGVLRIEGSSGAETWRIDADQVVNALWEQRIGFDRMIGLNRPAGWVHRLKYRVIARVPHELRAGPSATMVLGPYGDVVVRQDGTAYLSWYPAGLQGWTHEIAPPGDWDAQCRGEIEASKRESVARGILHGIDSWYPGMKDAKPTLIDAGAIVAYGKTDVDDAASALHDRTQIGVNSVDGYYSIDPGKLTTAPLFAQRAADLICDALGHK